MVTTPLVTAFALGPTVEVIERHAGWRTVERSFRAASLPLQVIEERQVYIPYAGEAALIEHAAREIGDANLALDDLSFVETHDCFTIAELLMYEAVGLTAEGQGARALQDGTVMPGGALPVNLSGGLKAKGHPVGATGVSMHVMVARQVSGEAGAMQRPGAERGLVVNMGGTGVANYATILEVERQA